MHELKRGVTLYEAKGGYDKQVRCEVVTILAKNEYALLMEHIRKNDPTAFVTVSTVSRDCRKLEYQVWCSIRII